MQSVREEAKTVRQLISCPTKKNDSPHKRASGLLSFASWIVTSVGHPRERSRYEPKRLQAGVYGNDGHTICKSNQRLTTITHSAFLIRPRNPNDHRPDILGRVDGWTSRSQPDSGEVPLSPSGPKLVMPQLYQSLKPTPPKGWRWFFQLMRLRELLGAELLERRKSAWNRRTHFVLRQGMTRHDRLGPF